MLAGIGDDDGSSDGIDVVPSSADVLLSLVTITFYLAVKKHTLNLLSTLLNSL